ncbi:DUF7948 domain-containing protein [Taibaiella koreensis]|uniref:DUF7948 domain-containing protein n=1 Tax=Taibaiella koreensis TaxID=1268548 RepID=UPI000E59D094|nr:gliding motility-associated C-terminal domain-containing protein [Taibaiella koreensis]
MNLNIYKKALFLSLFLLTGAMAFARVKHPVSETIAKLSQKKPGFDFIENKGQWTTEARFKANLPGGVLFLTDQGFVYNYVSGEDMERVHELGEEHKDLSKEVVRSHAYRVNFAGANTGITYKQESKRSTYHNYFIGNDRSKWAGNVGLYGKVSMQNVYNNIDVAVYSKQNALKYDIIVRPGADAAQIKLTFDGVQPELNADGALKIKTSVNEVIEQAPYSYQVINGKEVPVPSRYVLDKGQLTFAFPEGYNTQYELVIDPTLVFATYSGGTAGGFSGFYGFSTTYDNEGNAYAGCGAGGAGWPTSFGPAFQPAYSAAGNFIVGINKYNALGTALVYSTYYGGTTGPEFVHTMKVNDLGELIIAGSAQSNNIPTSPGCFDNTLGGIVDLFVAHFNTTGTALIGATYIGGSGAEPNTFNFTGLNNFGFGNNGDNFTQHTTSPVEINTDAAGNIWLVSNTKSTDFPLTANAQQAALSGAGTTDGVICKLDPTCSQLLYSSYLGGTGDDGIFSTQFNSAGNVVIGGVTQSNDFPTTAGAKTTAAPSAGGSLDGFVSIINATTGAIMRSTYMGTANSDQVVAVQVDENDRIFAFGRTDGPYPVSTGVYSIGGGDVFIDRLSPDLSTSQLSTLVGSGAGFAHYFPDGFLVDICGNAYVTGMQAPAGLPTTADAASAAPLPFWFCVLKPNFQDLLYGSYFGVAGDHVHVGNNRLDPNGIVYHSICNNTANGWGNPSLITPNAWSPTKQSAGQDIITFKFDFEATGVISNFVLDTAIAKKDTGCVPYTIKMKNTTNSPTAAAATTFKWDFGDGSAIQTVAAPTHTYTTTGVFTITLYAHNDSACIKDDTAYMTITVLKTELPNITVKDTTICGHEPAINIGVTIHNPSPNNTIQWGPATGIFGPSNLATVSVDPSASSRYWVTVKDTIPGICGFSTMDTVHIDLAPRVLDIITNDTAVCQGAVVPIVAIGTNEYTYHWSPATGVSDTTVLQPVITINQPNIYTLTASYPNCPDTSVIISFDMHYIPKLDLGPDKDACQWTDVALESSITPFRNDYIYQWVPATPNLSNPNGPNTHLSADTTITYTLQVQTPIGCADQDSITLTVYPGAFGAATADTGYCPGGQAQLWATGGVSYTWSPAYGLSDSSAASPLATPLTSTDYTVLIKDVHNCADTEQVSVQVYSQAMLNLPDSVTVYPGEQYHVEPGTNCMYFTWFPPSGLSATNIADPLISPAVRTRYFVTASTEHGCMIKDSMDVLVKKTVIDMPNAFAPAGNNKVFKPAKRGIAQLKNFTIFNRWGNKVYTSANIDEGWDGTKDGKVLPMGVYIYIIEAVTDSGEIFTQEGNVTLIR